MSLLNLSKMLTQTGPDAAVITACQRAVTLFKATNAPANERAALSLLCYALLDTGRIGESVVVLHEHLTACRESGDQR